MKKTERIPLPTPDFGPKASPAELVIKWSGRSATVAWSCGLQSTHNSFFRYIQFLDPDSAWSDRLARRLHNDHFSWERGRAFLNVPRQELNRVSLETTEFIRSSINDIFAEARQRYIEFLAKHPEPDAAPEPEPLPLVPKPKWVMPPIVKPSTQTPVRRYTEAGSD